MDGSDHDKVWKSGLRGRRGSDAPGSKQRNLSQHFLVSQELAPAPSRSAGALLSAGELCTLQPARGRRTSGTVAYNIGGRARGRPANEVRKCTRVENQPTHQVVAARVSRIGALSCSEFLQIQNCRNPLPFTVDPATLTVS